MSHTKNKQRQLLHIKHSFKLVHHRHTSYPMLALLMLCTGIFALGWTTYVSGATNGGEVLIRAKIAANPLSQPATIDTPNDHQRFTNAQISVGGFCPNTSYVSLLRNNVYAGTAICDADNHWQLQITLTPGTNLLQAQAYNITNDAGPISNQRQVFYDPPQVIEQTVEQTPTQTVASNTAAPSQPAKMVSSLVIGGSFSYFGVTVGDELIETFSISGGQAPYAISVDWGDGTTGLQSVGNAGNFLAKHVYSVAGSHARSTYVISVRATDASGNAANLQTMAVVTNPNGNTTARPTSTGSGLFSGFGGTTAGGQTAIDTFWQLTAPVYTVSFVALGSFWLGKRRELEVLQHVASMHHKRR